MKKLLFSAIILTACSVQPLLLSATAATPSPATINLSPNANKGSGAIPSGYAVVNFKLSNGNWSATLSLPSQASNGDTINISSSAGYNSNLAAGNTDLGIATLLIKTGDKLSFVFNSNKKQWIISSIPVYSPNTNGANVPPLQGIKIARYQMSDANWVGSVVLPVTADDNTVVLVSSNATWDSSVSTNNIQFASTLKLKRGDSYAFLYKASLQHWVLVGAPVREYIANGTASTIPALTSPRLSINLNDKNWTSTLTLPVNAGDRDRIVIQSSTAKAAVVNNTNIEYQGTLKLNKGTRYEFLYIKDKNKWVLQTHTRTLLNAQQLAGGKVPDIITPVTEVKAADGNWTGNVVLPSAAKPGDQVIVRSDATWSFKVVAANSKFGSKAITKGDNVRFMLDSNKQWVVSTNTIGMLLTYSDEAVTRLGETAMKTRMLEGFRLTNEAAQNSLANFYVKLSGWLKYNIPGETLGAVLDAGRTDTTVQKARDAVAADAVYYEGTEEGCGLAWVNQTPSAFNMLGTGSLNCGTTVMRHEFGHNMGLNHGGEPSKAVPYAQGYTLLGTVMGGNSIPYYSNPNLYTQDFGLAMGIKDQIDGVRAMNERSEAVSKFR